MDHENEIWGVLSKDEFEDKLKDFGIKFGKPSVSKRMAIQIIDLDDKTLWTRIRITDGKAEVMQKVADWDADERIEISIPLPADADIIFHQYQILKNLLKTRRHQAIIIQHKNFIFKTHDYEIKISHQYGTSSKYPFEIESKKRGLNLQKVSDELGLVANASPKGEKFWNEWNKEVNLDAATMTEEEIRTIISKYLT